MMNVTYPVMSGMDVLTVPATIERNPELWSWCLEQTGATVIPATGSWHGPTGVVTEESIVIRMLHTDIAVLRHVANVIAEMAAKVGESEVWAIPTRDVQVIVFELGGSDGERPCHRGSALSASDPCENCATA